LSSAKIVVNGAIDMSGNDRGNMRCWETLGCRALMLSDNGNYPSGMKAGTTIETYDSVDDFIEKIDLLLMDAARREKIASDGFAMIKSEYSKERQWTDFQNLVN
jgi:spore maturation protein CgeB